LNEKTLNSLKKIDDILSEFVESKEQFNLRNLYRYILKGSVKEAIQDNTKLDSKVRGIIRPVFEETLNQKVEEYINAIRIKDYDKVWRLTPIFQPSLIKNIINGEKIIFLDYLDSCSCMMMERGIPFKYLNLISFSFTGNSNTENKFIHTYYLQGLKFIEENSKRLSRDAIRFLRENPKQTYSFEDDIWITINWDVEAFHRVQLEFGDIKNSDIKYYIKEYIHSLINNTRENYKKIQHRLSNIKTLLKELLNIYHIYSLIEINYFHVIHLVDHFQTMKKDDGSNKYKLSSIRMIFTEMRLLYDWFLNEKGVGELANPFRRYQFKNSDSFVENAEYIPENVIEQLQDKLVEAPEYIQNAWVIMMNTGMRISDALDLEEGCIEYNAELKTHILKYVPRKQDNIRADKGMDKYHRIPVGKHVINCVNRQKTLTQEYRDISDTKKIFIYLNGYGITTNNPQYMSDEINRIIRKYNIKDPAGEIFYYKHHQCRKTLVVDLLSKGLSIGEVAEYIGHLEEKSTERAYRDIDKKKVAELDSALFEKLFDFQLDNDTKEQFSIEEKKSLMKEIKLGVRETPEGHGHCAKHVSFGPCRKKKCVGCRLLITGPQKLPMWKNLYEGQKVYLEELKDNYIAEGVTDYESHIMYQEQVNLLYIYKNTIEQVEKFAKKEGISLE
jgi:integrase